MMPNAPWIAFGSLQTEGRGCSGMLEVELCGEFTVGVNAVDGSFDCSTESTGVIVAVTCRLLHPDSAILNEMRESCVIHVMCTTAASISANYI